MDFYKSNSSMDLQFIALCEPGVVVDDQVKKRFAEINSGAVSIDLAESYSGQQMLEGLLAYNQKNTLSPDGYSVIFNPRNVCFADNLSEFQTHLGNLNADVLFAADANFEYGTDLEGYYLWKYYPRRDGPYYYLNQDLWIIKNRVFSEFLLDVSAHLLKDSTWKPKHIFARFYLDISLDILAPSYRLSLDHTGKILGSAAGSTTLLPMPTGDWVIEHLRYRAELKATNGFSRNFRYRFNGWSFKKGLFKSSVTKTHPIAVAFASSEAQPDAGKANIVWQLKSLWWYVIAVFQYFFVLVVNRFTTSPKELFRFEKNKNPDYDGVMQRFLQHLRSNTAFTFAHFNDGELNFIRKYLVGDHKKTWTGRLQNQYDQKLAAHLIEAIQHQQDNYYLGVNCTICGSARRVVADELMGEYRHKIGSMVLHHNQRYIPKMLSLMRGRDVYFVKNDYQDLTYFTQMGIEVKSENQLVIPFVNSYKHYDDLKDKKFPDGAVVLLMCGMLAKILNKVWYENNPKTTFIAYGSTMDDFIQREHTKYRTFPKELPVTRNVFFFKAFLFGAKKHCDECYNI
ncbi:MAG: hypothetical protein ACJAZM_002984 [Cyclobacteriaceae bacterium]|jgi:hypothetical protein